MGLRDELEEEVGTIFRKVWTERDGEVVPSEDSIKLGNDGVKLDATVLYADMAEPPQDPAIRELLDRILRIESQLARPAPTEPPASAEAGRDRLSVLEQKIRRFGDHLSNLWDDFTDHRTAQADKFESAFERIKGLEVSVFPELPLDIERVHQIIGGNGVPAEPNPLDTRSGNPPMKLPE